jgi:hypothetical protein
MAPSSSEPLNDKERREFDNAKCVLLERGKSLDVQPAFLYVILQSTYWCLIARGYICSLDTICKWDDVSKLRRMESYMR